MGLEEILKEKGKGVSLVTEEKVAEMTGEGREKRRSGEIY